MNDYIDYESFTALGAPRPSIIFDPMVFDDSEVDCPLVETRQNRQRLPGCYAFFQPSEREIPGSVFRVHYVGKAVRLRNRIAHHWRHGADWLDEWGGGCPFPETFWPLIAVWFSDEREALERTLIEALQPSANIQIA